MLQNLFISFREFFEAILVIGIILTYVTKNGDNHLKKYVVGGTITGFIASVALGVFSYTQAHELAGKYQEQFEGVMMIIASGLIAYFVVWMVGQDRNISESINHSLSKKSTGMGLFILAFLSVFREGLELMFFTLTNLTSNATMVALGSLIGLTLAIIAGVIIFKSSLKLNIKWIFKVLGIIIIYLGAQMFSQGILRFVDAGNLLQYTLFTIYALFSLVYFLKSDIKKFLNKG